jgi:hypothetical protein
MAAPHTGVMEVGDVAEGAEVREPILNHCLAAGPDATSAGRVGAACRTRLQQESHRGPRRPAADARRLRA